MVSFAKFSSMSGARSDPFQIFDKEKILKILVIIGFLLTTYNFLVLFLHQSQGYVVDIYSELPLQFFISLILCFTLGSAILFFGRGITRKLGTLLLILTYSAILLIPYMLGYYSMGRADDMTYIGEYLQISTSGTIAGWDIYPASHILGAALTMVTGLAPNLVSFIIPFVFSYLFVGGLILFSRCFLNDDQMLVSIAIPSSLILYLGPYNFLNVPHSLFFAMMPLFLFILYRFIKEKQNFSSILLIFPLTFLIPFMHPFIVFFVVLILLIMIIISPIMEKFFHENYKQVIIPLLIVITGFLAWFLNTTRLLGNFRQSFLSYVYKATEPVFFETAEKLAKINISYFKIIKLLTLFYGRYVIPFLFIAGALTILFFQKNRISQILKKRMVFLLLFYFILFCIEAILFFNPFISHQPDRLTNLNFVIYAQVPLFALSLYVMLIKPETSCLKMLLLLLILSGIWGLSLFGTFDSPNVFRTNVALTNNEVHGMQWFYASSVTENVKVPISQIDRFHDLFADGSVENGNGLPYHFGYLNDNRSFSEINMASGERGYIILLSIDELLYQKIPGYSEVGRYTAEDFHRFRNDDSINKIFDSTNIEIYSTLE